MSDGSPSITGAGYLQARSFAFAFNAAGNAAVTKALDPGAYVLVSDANVLVKLGASPTVAALPATQPAAGSPNATILVPAGIPVPLDVPSSGLSVSALGSSTSSGTLTVCGPVLSSAVRG